MTTILYDPEEKKISKEDFRVLIDHLRLGNVAILPTDTIYGFSCVATIPQAITKISKLKNRPNDKPYIVLVSSIAMARRYAYLDPKTLELAKEIWEKDEPTSLVLKAKDKLPDRLLSREGGISLRLPKSDLLIKIIRSLGLPLVSSSLNISGKSYIDDLSKLDKIYGPQLENVVLLDAGQTKIKPVSKILDIRSGAMKQIR